MITKANINTLSKKLLPLIGKNNPVVIPAPYYKKTTIEFRGTGYVSSSYLPAITELTKQFFNKYITDKVECYIEADGYNEDGNLIGTLCIEVKSLQFAI